MGRVVTAVTPDRVSSSGLPPRRPVLIAVIGDARCGSTIFDLHAGLRLGGTSLGEVARLWDEVLPQRTRCSCGSTALECPRWSRILREGGISTPSDPAVEVMARVGRLRGLAKRSFSTALHHEAVRTLDRFYRAIFEVCQTNIAIDSSKSPGYVDLLTRLPSVDVRVVHLVRKPISTVGSKSVPKRDPGRGGGRAMATASEARALADWVVSNAVSSVVARSQQQTTRVRLESLAASPELAFSQVFADLAVKPNERVRGSAAEQRHLIAGNPVRFEPIVPPLSLDRLASASSTSTRTTLVAGALDHLFRG